MLETWGHNWERWFYSTHVVRGRPVRNRSTETLRQLPFAGALLACAGVGALAGSSIAFRTQTSIGRIPLGSTWSLTFLIFFVLGIVLCVSGAVLWVIGRAIRTHILAS